MKVQDKKTIDREGQVKYIARERAILSQINGHPFIVRIEEAFQNEWKLFIILEYCPNGTLSRILAK